MAQRRVGDRVYAAIDLGASSGRVMAGILSDGRLEIEHVARFPSVSRHDGPHMTWDIATMFEASLDGLAEVEALAQSRGLRFAGIGVDSWGVDYGLLSRDCVDLEDVRHHRSAGVRAGDYDSFRTTPLERFQETGVLDQSINTVQQLAVRVREDSILAESSVLFIPDLWVHLLAGTSGTDPTIASTSQMLQLESGDWSRRMLDELAEGGLNMPPVRMAGSYAGATTAAVTKRIGASNAIPVFRVAGHDTASALGFAVPARRREVTSAVVSSGTWSLAGLCLDRATATPEAMSAGFTFERGLRGVLMLRNLSGLWLLQECLRKWSREDGVDMDPQAMTAAAATVPAEVAVLDLADPELLKPGGMPARVQRLAAECGRAVPESREQIVRVIIDSLASAYADTCASAARLAHVSVDQIRILGGGSNISLLCQETADRSGLTVVAGPAEATAVGNLVAQMWASGAVDSIAAGYGAVSERTWGLKVYEPSGIKTMSGSNL